MKITIFWVDKGDLKDMKWMMSMEMSIIKECSTEIVMEIMLMAKNLRITLMMQEILVIYQQIT
jgi:hypothetical protein